MSGAEPVAPTSVRVVLGDGGRRVLLLRRAADDDIHPGLWEMPGGGIEPGETAAEAAARELAEEVGLALTAADLADWARFRREDRGRARHTAFFVADCAPEDCSPALSREHDGWRWAEAGEDLPPLTPSTDWALRRRDAQHPGSDPSRRATRGV